MSRLIRTQLSLFVPAASGARLEEVRLLMDPVQGRLIAAHVTLCREEDITGVGLDELRAALRRSPAPSVTLRFGPAEVFHEHGVLLPCVGGEEEFQALRRHLLGAAGSARRQSPHLTLAHPRNPKSAHNDLRTAEALSDGLTITFPVVSLIEQEGSGPWKILEEYPLATTAPGVGC